MPISHVRFPSISSGNVVESIYQDPPAEPGTVEDALSNTLLSQLDLAPMPNAEADRVLEAGPRCTFNRSPETDPIFWTSEGGAAAMKLNRVLIDLEAVGEPEDGAAAFTAPGTTIRVNPLGEEAQDRRQNAELIFELEQGLTVGYRGFYACEAD